MAGERRSGAIDTGDPGAALRTLLDGYRQTQLLYVAAKLGIADILAAGPRTSAEIADAVGAHPQALHRVLRGLAVINVVHETGPGGFALTPMGELLKSDAPGDWHGNVIRLSESNCQAWASMLHTVRTGETAFDHVFGMGMFDYFAQHPEYAQSFSRHMARRTRESAAAIAAAYDFSAFQTVVDVGGGYGTLLATILRTNA